MNTQGYSNTITETSFDMALIEPNYNFSIEHPTLDGVVKFTVRVHEFCIAKYALHDEDLPLEALDIDDVDTCLFDIVEVTYVDSEGKATDITNNTDINGLIHNNCWLMIAETVLNDYITLSSTETI